MNRARTTKSNARRLLDVPESQPKKPSRESFWASQTTNQKLGTLAIIALTAGTLYLIGDVGTTADTTVCTTTEGAANNWDNGVLARADLQKQGAPIDDITDVVDPLVEKLDTSGARPGIEVCAVYNDSILGGFAPTGIIVTAP